MLTNHEKREMMNAIKSIEPITIPAIATGEREICGDLEGAVDGEEVEEVEEVDDGSF